MGNSDMLTFNEFVDENIDEVLDVSQRRKKGLQMKRMKAKLKIARKRAMRKTATTSVLKGRANRKARGDLAKKLAGGKSKSQLSISQKKSIEKRLGRMGSRIKAMSRSSLKTVRAADKARKGSKKK
jgi:hypothetical protein